MLYLIFDELMLTILVFFPFTNSISYLAHLPLHLIIKFITIL